MAAVVVAKAVMSLVEKARRVAVVVAEAGFERMTLVEVAAEERSEEVAVPRMVSPLAGVEPPIVEEAYALREFRPYMFLDVPVMSPPKLKLLIVPALIVLPLIVVEVAVVK